MDDNYYFIWIHMGCTTSNGKRGRTKPVLIYLDFYGRAEPIRMTLWAAKIAFEDRRLSMDDFVFLKNAKNFPSGQVPVW